VLVAAGSSSGAAAQPERTSADAPRRANAADAFFSFKVSS